jgi:uncharacterized membrane protein YtjA (UPF0391 family)
MTGCPKSDRFDADAPVAALLAAGGGRLLPGARSDRQLIGLFTGLSRAHKGQPEPSSWLRARPVIGPREWLSTRHLSCSSTRQRDSTPAPEESAVLYWAFVFLVLGVIAGALGFTTVAGASIAIAKFLAGLFVLLFVIFLLLGISAARRV